jgi:hypothetical protein
MCRATFSRPPSSCPGRRTPPGRPRDWEGGSGLVLRVGRGRGGQEAEAEAVPYKVRWLPVVFARVRVGLPCPRLRLLPLLPCCCRSPSSQVYSGRFPLGGLVVVCAVRAGCPLLAGVPVVVVCSSLAHPWFPRWVLPSASRPFYPSVVCRPSRLSPPPHYIPIVSLQRYILPRKKPI